MWFFVGFIVVFIMFVIKPFHIKFISVIFESYLVAIQTHWPAREMMVFYIATTEGADVLK